MLMTLLLPAIAGIELDDVAHESGVIHLTLRTTATQVGCPVCGQLSQDVHSRYGRSVADLPWAGIPVQATLWVRRFFCHNANCQRKIFCERLSPAIAPYARRTHRLYRQLQHLALELGGEAGSRLTVILGMLASPATLLRSIRSIECEERPTPRVLGVDDWAKHKGQSYGTLLVDLERHQPVDLLSERSSEALAKWLQEHPGVEIISRDRAEVYAEGATVGAPNAIQIADRFHLIQNLVDALKRLFNRHTSDLRTAAKQVAVPAATILDKPKDDQDPGKTSTSAVLADRPFDDSGEIPTDGVASDKVAATQRIKSLTELRFDEVKLLHKQGLSERAIARRLSMSRKTVRRYVTLDTYRRRTPGRQSTSKATTFLPYLHKRWQEGCRNVKGLFVEIQQNGFTGSYASVWRLINRSFDVDVPCGSARLSELITPRLSANQAAWLLIRRTEELDEKQKALQQSLLDVSHVATQAYPLAQGFRQLINERQVDALDPWLSQAKNSGIPELRRFATSLQSDYQVVRNALLYPWSNGQVEGQVNRLKLIKRQMYGRAGFELLRKKVLYAA